MGLIFISALFSHGGGSYRSIDKYKEQFALLAESGVQIVLYMDPDLKPYAEELEATYKNVRVAEFVSVDRSFLTDPLFLPRNRNEKKDTVEYFCIQLMKLKLLTHAAETLDCSHLAWIDFGIFHVFQDVPRAQELLRRIVQRDWHSGKILSPGCWPKERVCDIWNDISWQFCGGLLIGEKSLFTKAYKRQDCLVRSNMPGLTWEVNYWTLMPEFFTVYNADHDDRILINLT